MKRKLIFLVVILVLTVIPMTAYAEPALPITAAIGNLQYVSLGETSARMRNGLLTIQTQRLQATAVLSCNGDADCEAVGLDGAQVQMQQTLGIVIDVIGAGVMNGRSRTTLIILDPSGETELARFRFRGQISGSAFKGTDEELQAVMALTGNGRAGNQLDLDLTGTLVRDQGGNPKWQALGGDGALSLFGTLPN